MNENRRLILSIFWIMAGLALLVLSAAEVLDSSMFSGVGGALIAVGALQLARNLRYRKDPVYRERIKTEENDERNRFIRMKSWSWAGYIVVLLEAAGSVAAFILGYTTIQRVLYMSMCLILLVYWISYMVLSRKY